MAKLAGLPIAAMAMGVAVSAQAAPAFELTPKVVPLARETSLTLQAQPGARFEEIEHEVRIYPMEWRAGSDVAGVTTVKVRPESGALRISHRFADEQEYLVAVFGNDPKTALASFRVYAVADDLFSRRPYRGDLHQHSHHSDGKESPAYVAAYNRKLGMDFMALTDHHKYAPSLEAIKAFEGLPVDLRIFPGEEVHPPDTGVHIVHFGGKFSVNDLFKTPAYQEGVEQIVASLKEFPAGLNPKSYAACLWALEKIREAGGVSIFCHPYWITGNRYNVPEALITRLFAEKPFDAYEVIGGYWLHQTESNALQVARYYEEVAKGNRVPVVGVSDGHGVHRGLNGWYYTVVLAPSPDYADIRDAIRADYAVAVESLPNAPAARPYGPFRLVKYVSFLLREVFPAHDALCAEEGDAMLAYVAGDQDAVTRLKALQGRVAQLYARLWARE